MIFNDIKFLGAKRIDQAANMGVHVEMTGQGCRHFEEVAVVIGFSFLQCLMA